MEGATGLSFERVQMWLRRIGKGGGDLKSVSGSTPKGSQTFYYIGH